MESGVSGFERDACCRHRLSKRPTTSESETYEDTRQAISQLLIDVSDFQPKGGESVHYRIQLCYNILSKVPENN